MRRKVYRSLDRPAAVFGIRGRFLWVAALLGAFALVVGIVTGGAASMLAGTGAGIVCAAAAYLLVLSVQSRVDEKDLVKVIVKRSFPDLYRMRPMHVRNIWRGFNLSLPKYKHSGDE